MGEVGVVKIFPEAPVLLEIDENSLSPAFPIAQELNARHIHRQQYNATQLHRRQQSYRTDPEFRNSISASRVASGASAISEWPE